MRTFAARLRSNHGTVVAYLGLFVALGGVSYAAINLPKNSVGTKQLKPKAVKRSDLALGAVNGSRVANGSLAAGDFAAGQLPRGPRGATGPQGATGEQGIQGLAGTARAYASVRSHFFDSCAPTCGIARARGVSQVTRVGTGQYCVRVPGVSSDDVSAVVSVEFLNTFPPTGNASVAVDASSSTCPGTDFDVHAYRRGSTSVRNAADTGATNVAAYQPVHADDVAFTIVIP